MSNYNMGRFRPVPKGEFDPFERYEFLDFVYYDGSSYICINEDLVDGVSCTGVLPVGQDESENYWQIYAAKGSKGDKVSAYTNFIEVGADGIWDFNESDKCILSVDAASLTIENAYDGCCGIIITENKDFTLPSNSEFALDFGYMAAYSNQYYMYTFVCVPTEQDTLKFIWNRTVINHG